MSDSHTNFDGNSFGAAASGGAATLAGALVAGVANVARARADAWANWTREQLVTALSLADLLIDARTAERDSARRRLADSEAEVRRLQAVIRRMTARTNAPR